MKVEAWQLKQRQGLPLKLKIARTQQAIRDWYRHWGGEVFVSFSGGLDSTVLLHTARELYPDIPAVFIDALAYPEIREHVKATENVEKIRPAMPFHRVIAHYGYPVVSKRVSQYVSEVQRSLNETATKKLRLTGIRKDGSYYPAGMIPKKWRFLCNAPFQIHYRCCDQLKKKPLDKQAQGRQPLLGIRVTESMHRKQSYHQFGCNAFNLKRPRSWPLAFWTHDDIWEYIRRYDVPYASIYDRGYTSTGCFACMFGVHLEKEPNRFQRMRKTHPKLWNYCERIGIPEVLDYIGVPYTTNWLL